MNKNNLIVTGVSLGAAIGSAWLMYSKASDRKKHDLKRHANKAVKAAGTVVDDITSIVK